MKVLAVTGYKPQEMGLFRADAPEIVYIKYAIKNRLNQFAEDGIEWIVISGQPGVEQWAAEVVMEMKQVWPNLKLAVLPPFLHQERIWPEQAQDRYFQIVRQADYTEEISKKEYESPRQLRVKNDFIVTKTDALLLLYNEEQPGTPAYYLEAAERRAAHDDYPIFWITTDELQDTAEDLNNEHNSFLE